MDIHRLGLLQKDNLESRAELVSHSTWFLRLISSFADDISFTLRKVTTMSNYSYWRSSSSIFSPISSILDMSESVINVNLDC